jgi:phosphatidylserine/phosphatidylglycerophosphate/cardiolipin synthase-like enzyme
MLESKLGALPDDADITVRSIQRFSLDRSPSDEEVLAALHGLTALGVLSRHGSRWRLHRAQLDATEGYRRGIRDGIEVARSTARLSPPTLCAALPVGLPSKVEVKLRAAAVDLRAALFDIVAAARSRVVLASPFWDAETAEELCTLLERRMAAGVQVDLLGRQVTDRGLGVLYSRLGARPSCNVFAWHAPSTSDRYRTQTFHFKAGIADDGARAYVGSANFTTAGLRSRMELGVVLDGAAAAEVAMFVDTVLLVAQRCARPDIAAPVDYPERALGQGRAKGGSRKGRARAKGTR